VSLRPAVALLLAVALGAPAARAQDTTRAGRDSARADSARADSLRVLPPRADTVVADTVRWPLAVHERVEARVNRGLRVCAGGDVALGTNLDTSWATRASKSWRRPVAALPDPDSLLAPLHPLFASADVVLLNVEAAIGENPVPPKCDEHSTACYALRMPMAAAAALRRVNDSAAVVGNVANNHARDAGPEGLDTTVAHLLNAGVLVTGFDTIATLATTPYGDTVAVLGFSTSGPPDARDLAAVRRHVARASAQWPRVIVTMHLGAEGVKAQRTRDSTEVFYGSDRGNPVRFADAVLRAGADLVIGHGPHVMRAMRFVNGRLVAYSLGNLLTYGPFSMRPPLDRSGVLCATLADSGAVTEARLLATRQVPPGGVRPDPSGRAGRLADSLARLDFPRDGARVLRDGTVVPRPPTASPTGRARPTPRRRSAPQR
jgi:hypothetical protein